MASLHWNDELYQEVCKLYVVRYNEIQAVCFAESDLRKRIVKARMQSDDLRVLRYEELLARFINDACYPSAALLNKAEGGFRGVLLRAGLHEYISTRSSAATGDKIARMIALQKQMGVPLLTAVVSLPVHPILSLAVAEDEQSEGDGAA